MPDIRRLRPDDVASLVELVHRCLREVNSRDYSPEIIDAMCGHYDGDRFAQLARVRDIYVAEQEHTIVATVSREQNRIFTMFVDPDRMGAGIGRVLMRHAELAMKNDGHEHVEVNASITAQHFYRALGYVDVRLIETEFGLTYAMHRTLP